jgi:hypothetical protein
VTRVDLPEGAQGPFDVYVNGVRQQEGTDYKLEPGAIAFTRTLVKEGKLGFWRWTAMALSLFGSYRKNESVDIHFTRNGKREVAVDVRFEAPTL